MRVICDDCPLLKTYGKMKDLYLCRLGYCIKQIFTKGCGKKLLDGKKVTIIKYSVVSDACRLVKIVTLDGEIYPEQEEVKG